jgi:hypothetical protein
VKEVQCTKQGAHFSRILAAHFSRILAAHFSRILAAHFSRILAAHFSRILAARHKKGASSVAYFSFTIVLEPGTEGNGNESKKKDKTRHKTNSWII